MEEGRKRKLDEAIKREGVDVNDNPQLTPKKPRYLLDMMATSSADSSDSEFPLYIPAIRLQDFEDVQDFTERGPVMNMQRVLETNSWENPSCEFNHSAVYPPTPQSVALDLTSKNLSPDDHPNQSQPLTSPIATFTASAELKMENSPKKSILQDSYVRDMKEETSSDESIRPVPFECSQCRVSEGSSLFLCQSCNKSCQCLHCSASHLRQKHTLTDLQGNRVISCSDHKLVSTLYCGTCKVTLCCQCLLKHVNHAIEDLEQVVLEIRGRVVNALEEAENRDKTLRRSREKFDKFKESQLSNCDSYIQKRCTRIKKAFSDILCTLSNEREDEISNMIKYYSDKEAMASEDALSDSKQYIEKLKQLINRPPLEMVDGFTNFPVDLNEDVDSKQLTTTYKKCYIATDSPPDSAIDKKLMTNLKSIICDMFPSLPPPIVLEKFELQQEVFPAINISGDLAFLLDFKTIKITPYNLRSQSFMPLISTEHKASVFAVTDQFIFYSHSELIAKLDRATQKETAAAIETNNVCDANGLKFVAAGDQRLVASQVVAGHRSTVVYDVQSGKSTATSAANGELVDMVANGLFIVVLEGSPVADMRILSHDLRVRQKFTAKQLELAAANKLCFVSDNKILVCASLTAHFALVGPVGSGKWRVLRSFSVGDFPVEAIGYWQGEDKAVLLSSETSVKSFKVW